MNQEIRNKLRNVVTLCRTLLEKDIRSSLEGTFSIYEKDGEVIADAQAPMVHLVDEEERKARIELLEHFQHITARGFKPKDSLDQLVREIAFTHLNRLCAYKMMEAREVYINGHKFREAVSRGIDSNGVKFYLADHPEEERLFNTGQQYIAYRHFLDSLGGLLSDEIGVLFNPNDPANRLYPKQKTLDDVLELLNYGNIKPEETELREEWPTLWSQDETIGWVYQYFTPKELRDQARKDSPAPRNSYELAFRNQFFTPRYVVEFLTDNTLGRIWYQMRKGETKLKDQCRYMVRRPNEVFLKEGEQPPKDTAEGTDDLSQEELVNLPVHIPHRPKKDPRDLRILDPASGSGHFLLYCFDLLLTIYEEAYTDPELGPALQKEKDYPTLDALRRDVPRLILAHNLHGIDIDLRCSQIAALALWLRCQRAYQEMGLKKDRPKITRSNFVCAEPMPGEQPILHEFIGELEPRLLGQLVEVVFDKMKLAGEAGSLLKIEDDIRDAVAEARSQWLVGPLSVQQSLFDDAKPVMRQERFDFSGITNTQFFEQAEAKVVAALRQYAERAQNGHRLQRRLFTDDAERGFAFVDLCHKKFDLVLMNPPFGDSSVVAATLLDEQLSESGRDLGSTFVSAAISRWAPEGLVGTVLPSSPLFKPTFAEWRSRNLLGDTAFIDLVAHFGGDILDGATVSASALVITKQHVTNATFFRLIREKHKQQGLESSIDGVITGRGSTLLHVTSLTGLASLPGSPIAYWISRSLQKRFASLPSFEGSGGTVKQGTATADEFRFARAWWEVPSGDNRWMPYTKTSEYSPFWDDPTWVLNFANSGEEIRATGKGRIQGTDFFGRAGVSYPSKSVLGFNPRVHPSGGAFGHTGSVAFPSRLPEMALLGLLASRPVEYALSLFLGSLQGEAGFHPLHYEVGVIQRLPFPELSDDDSALLSELANCAVKEVRQLFRRDETSHDFVEPAWPRRDGLVDSISLTYEEEENAFTTLNRVRSEMDQIVARAYGFTTSDIQEMDHEFGERIPPATGRWRRYFGVEPDAVCHEDLVGSLLSHSVGIVFGRWDVRYSTGQCEQPCLSEAFDNLPVCSPGMLQDAEHRPAIDFLSAYPFRIDSGGTLVDDADHLDDVIRRVQDVLELICGGRAQDIEREACEILGVKELREYFRRPGKGGFWGDHISRYSKARRKAPVYWLLQSSKKNYGLWLYYHRLDKDLLFKTLVNYIEPKMRLETNRLETFRSQEAAAGESGKEAKRLAKEVERQEDFLSELRDFEDKLRRAANLHLEPDLNDGVVLNIAPLYELVPWKDAKSYWDELLEGKYEWSAISKQLRQKGLVK